LTGAEAAAIIGAELGAITLRRDLAGALATAIRWQSGRAA
jgi:hypothetical protein